MAAGNTRAKADLEAQRAYTAADAITDVDRANHGADPDSRVDWDTDWNTAL
jgi:hypothetical protein